MTITNYFNINKLIFTKILTRQGQRMNSNGEVAPSVTSNYTGCL